MLQVVFAEVRMGCAKAALWEEAVHIPGGMMHSMAREEDELNWP